MDYLSQLRVDNLHRFVFPMQGHGGTVFFYIPVLFLGFFPWSIFLPVAWFQGIKDLKKVRGGNSREIPGQGSQRELECFAALWVATLFSFFTVASTRLPHYLGPLFPAAAMLVAIYFDQSKKVGLLARSSKFRTVAFGMGAAMIFSLQILSIEVILPYISRSFISPAQDLAARAGRMLGGKGTLLLYGISRPSLVFYARHKAIMIGEGQEESLSTLLNASQPTLLLLPSRLQSRLPTEAKGLTTVMQLGDAILLGNGF
jgi:4-amino-4-deoxy-L-arabinose transferase-like glycosyltransferase